MNNMLAKITAKEKAMIVIESCVTQKQLSSALNYLYNYYKLFKDDIEGHEDLVEIFVNKRLELYNQLY